MVKESESRLYDSLERCYVLEFARGDERRSYYFMLLPEAEMPSIPKKYQLSLIKAQEVR